jgi:hypothetical protein
VPANGQIDIQVEALEGYTSETSYDAHIMFVYAGFTFYGQESGWSNTQTVSIGETSASASPSPAPTLNPTSTSTPTLTVPEFSWLAVLPLFAAMLFVAIKLRHRKSPLCFFPS